MIYRDKMTFLCKNCDMDLDWAVALFATARWGRMPYKAGRCSFQVTAANKMG